MLRFLLNRFGMMLVTMLVISMLVFFIAEVVPIDPARNALGRYATQEKVDQLRESMGLNRPVIVRYFNWISNILRGDFGESIHFRRPVRDLVAVRLRLLPGTSIPDPDASFLESSKKLILPILVLSLDEIGYLARFTRVSMAEVLESDYIRTAVLKGIPKIKVIWRHALRNALIAPFTAMMLHINWLIGGVVVVEVLFGYPGLGSLILEGAMRNDITLLEGGTLVLTFVAVATQVIGDIIIYFINPRIRFE
jgi:peptide/nickel transport system permease protein